MSLPGGMDNLTFLLVSCIALLAAAVILFWALKRYEVAIILVLLSPWVHWLFQGNVEQTVEEMTSVGAATYLRMLVVLLGGAIGLLTFMRLRAERREKLPPYLILFGLFLLYALFSTVYSIDKRYTFIRASEFLWFFAFLLGLYYWLENRERLDRVLKIYFWLCASGVLMNAAALAALPGRVWCWEMPDRFQGLLEHPNTFGAFCMVSYPVVLWKYGRTEWPKRLWVVLLFCLILGLHILSGSRASMAASFLGFLVWVLVSGRRADLRHLARVLAFIVVGFISVFIVLQWRPTSLYRHDEAAITTLTGRTDFWRGCAQLIGERPISGYGYAVAGKVWQDPRFYRAGDFLWSGTARSSLHNGYLSLAIGLGVVGLGLWLAFLVIPVRDVMRLEASAYKAFMMAMVAQALLVNFFESYISAGSQMLTSLVFWFFIVVMSRLPALVCGESERQTAEVTVARTGAHAA